MYPRKPLSHGDQLARLKAYLRRAHTKLRHEYEELFECTRKRRDCPLEVSIRCRAVEHADTTVKLLEVCIKELERQQAMSFAPFKPGDRIIVESEGKFWGPYMITNVLPDKKTCYSYECVALTKRGCMYKSGGDTRVSPHVSRTIVASDAELNADGKWEAEYFRRRAETARRMAFETGDLRLFEVQKTVYGSTYYRRKDMLDPPGQDA